MELRAARCKPAIPNLYSMAKWFIAFRLPSGIERHFGRLGFRRVGHSTKRRLKRALPRYIARYNLAPIRYIASNISGADWRLSGSIRKFGGSMREWSFGPGGAANRAGSCAPGFAWAFAGRPEGFDPGAFWGAWGGRGRSRG